jgi:hypothetical protein
MKISPMPPRRCLSLRGPPELPQLRRGQGCRAATHSRRRSAQMDAPRGAEWTQSVGGFRTTGRSRHRTTRSRQRGRKKRLPPGCRVAPPSPEGRPVRRRAANLLYAAPQEYDAGSGARRGSARDEVQHTLRRRGPPPRREESREGELARPALPLSPLCGKDGGKE